MKKVFISSCGDRGSLRSVTDWTAGGHGLPDWVVATVMAPSDSIRATRTGFLINIHMAAQGKGLPHPSPNPAALGGRIFLVDYRRYFQWFLSPAAPGSSDRTLCDIGSEPAPSHSSIS